MNKKILGLVFSLALLAAGPVQSQVVTMPTPMPAAGGGGGGGDASAANQTTQIGALPLEDALHVTGDRGSFSLGVENDDQAILSTGDKAYTPFGVTARGQVINIPMLTTSIPDTNQLGKQDSAAHINTDVGVPSMSLANEGQTQLSTSDNQYQMTAADREGNQSVILLNSLAPYAAGRQVSHLEDVAHGSGDAGIPSWGVIHTGLGIVGSIGDYSQFSTDLAGRQFNIPMTTPNTAITFQLGKTEDSASSAGDTGVPSMTVRRDVLIEDASVSADGDFLHSFSDNTGAVWVRNATVTKSLFAGVSTTSSSTIVDVAGYTMGMVHYTNDATFDRTGTFAINVSVGNALVFKPVVGAVEVRQDPGPSTVWQHTDPNAISLAPVADRTRGYMVNLMGFQALQVEVTITGAGTTGVSEFHIHLYSGGSGFNQEMSLGTDADIIPVIGGRPPLIQFIGGRSTSAGVSLRGLFLPDEDDPHTSGDSGIMALAIRNATPTPAATTGIDLDYSPIGVSNLTQVLTVLHHNSAYLGTINATKQEDVGHGSTDAGIPAWGVVNTAFATRAGNNDYVSLSTAIDGVQFVYPRHDGGVSQINQLTKSEDSTANSGDAGVMALAVTNENQGALASGVNDDYIAVATDSFGRQQTTLHHSTAYTAAAQVTKTEDSTHTTGDPAMPMLGVSNNSLGEFSGANSRYTPMALTTQGSPIGVIINSTNVTGLRDVSKAEDDFINNNNEALLAVATLVDDVLSAGAGTSGDGSATFLRVDNRGGLWVAESGASFFAITDTGIAAVSQNFSFGFTSKKVRISAPSSNTVGVCIDHAGGTAICPSADTAGDDVVEPGESIELDRHAVTSVSAIAVSGTQTIVVRAFN